MAEMKKRRRMPGNHLLLKKEIRALLEEDPSMSRSEVKRRILENRNLPTDPGDPYWWEQGGRRSQWGKHRTRWPHFEDLFKYAWDQVRKGK